MSRPFLFARIHASVVCLAAVLALWATHASAVARYVWRNGAHIPPYTNWVTAATNITAALSVSLTGDEIIVTNGIYYEPATLNLNRTNLILRSVNGPAVTIIDGRSAMRVIICTVPGVQLHGFTCRNGDVSGNGAGININSPNTIVSNCIIAHNRTAGNTRWGAGLWAAQTLVIDCLLISNSHAGLGISRGGGAFCTNGARLIRCQLLTNSATYGAGAFLSSTTAEGCVFAANAAASRGAGAYMEGGAIVTNCTFLANQQITSLLASDGGGALYLAGPGIVAASRFTANEARRFGGAIFINNVAARVLAGAFALNRTAQTGAGMGGGAIYINGNGLVSDSRFDSNLSMGAGGAILFTNGGAAQRCIFSKNTAAGWGGGVAFYGAGSITNSLFHQNVANEGGGIYCWSDGAQIYSCTLTENSSTIGAGGLDCAGNTIVRNTIVYDNYAPTHINYRLQAPTARWRNCCTFPAITGAFSEGVNITNHPRFLAPAASLYWLATNSPCINAGTNESWMFTASDLAGQSRIIQSIADIGAYELGSLMCAFSATPRTGQHPLPVQFYGYVTGTNTSSLVYFWDFDAPSGFDLIGSGAHAPAWTYTNDGIFSVRLMVSNAAAEIAQCAASNYIFVISDIRYVATNGPHIFPFTSWATAASNIQSAVAISSDHMTVLVSCGTYRVTAPILVTNAITIRSVCGPARTIVDGMGTSRCFYVAANARIDGFTISNGWAGGTGLDAYGGGVLCFNDGILSNCVFVRNVAAGYGGGAATYGGGMIHSSFFSTNTAHYGGGAVCYNHGSLVNCIFSRNVALADGGAIFCDFYGVARNNLVFNNAALTNGGGIITRDSGGLVQNCTVASNRAARGGGLASQSGGAFYNTISYFNAASLDPATSNWYSYVVGVPYGQLYQYCCTAPIAGLPNQFGCIANNPQFNDMAAADFRLRPASACINAGVNQGWMSNAVDLDGFPRIREGRVDIGAYEYLLAFLRITNTFPETRLPFHRLHHHVAGTSTGLAGFLWYSNIWSAYNQQFSAHGSLTAAPTWSVSFHLPHHGTFSFIIRGTNIFGDQLEDTVRYMRMPPHIFTIRSE